MYEKGMVVGGRYRLVREVGKGGMATIWEAEHLTLGSPCAVKFLHTAQGPNHDKLIERFMQEARVAAAVRHRNVVEIMDFGLLDDTTPYMVMELLEGQSLADRMDLVGAMELTQAVFLASLTLRGLGAVHDAGIVHRDLKPENIFLIDDPDGTFPKLLDFGVSRRADIATNLTQEGMLVGTPDYMSPEQARGLRDIDRRTDVYSMGVILYEMLTNRLPFESENVGDLIVMVTTQQPTPILEYRPETPEDLAEVIERAMKKDREERFADAREMRHALMAASQDLGLGFGDPDSGLSFVSELPPAEGTGARHRALLEETPAEGPPPPAPTHTPSMADVAAKDRRPTGAAPAAPAPPPPPPPRSPDADQASDEPMGVGAVGTPAPAQKPTSAPRWPLMTLLVLTAAGLGIASALYLPFRPPWEDPEGAEQPAAPWEPASASLPPMLLDAGTADAGATVRVAVIGMPENALLRIDGVPVDGNEAWVPAGDWTYSLEVLVDGGVAWRSPHPGDVDGEYQVWMGDSYDAGVGNAENAPPEDPPGLTPPTKRRRPGRTPRWRRGRRTGG